MIFGKWVSNYKNEDKVLVINKDFKLLSGRLCFTKEHFTEDCFIFIDNLKHNFKDFLLVCNVESNNFYEENTHILYKALYDNKCNKLKLVKKKIEKIQIDYCYFSESNVIDNINYALSEMLNENI